jgi:hypothetical protein
MIGLYIDVTVIVKNEIAHTYKQLNPIASLSNFDICNT